MTLPVSAHDALRRLSEGAYADLIGPLSALVSQPGELATTLRPVALFARTFAEIFETGERRPGTVATSGLRATEWHTQERGSILFIDNPDADQAVTGSVFPYLPQVRLEPGEVFAYVHNAPIGASHKYLAAYVGLVKSDAPVLTARLRPDPYEGAEVYVYDEPGATKEVAIFHGYERAQGVDIRFDTRPRLYTAGPSWIVALPRDLAGRTFFMENGSVLIGPDALLSQAGEWAVLALAPERAVYGLLPDGTLTCAAPEPVAEHPWDELTDIAGPGNGPGWYRAAITTDEHRDATLHLDGVSGLLTLFHNGRHLGGGAQPSLSFPLRLVPGENVISVQATGADAGINGPVTVIPEGGCFLIDITRWQHWSVNRGVSVVKVGISGGLGYNAPGTVTP